MAGASQHLPRTQPQSSSWAAATHSHLARRSPGRGEEQEGWGSCECCRGDPLTGSELWRYRAVDTRAMPTARSHPGVITNSLAGSTFLLMSSPQGSIKTQRVSKYPKNLPQGPVLHFPYLWTSLGGKGPFLGLAKQPQSKSISINEEIKLLGHHHNETLWSHLRLHPQFMSKVGCKAGQLWAAPSPLSLSLSQLSLVYQPSALV